MLAAPHWLNRWLHDVPGLEALLPFEQLRIEELLAGLLVGEMVCEAVPLEPVAVTDAV